MAPVKVIKNYHILRNYFKKRFVSKFKRKSKVQCIDEKNIDVILSQHPASEIFIHAGLSDIKSGLNVSNPTDWVVTKFSNYYSSILAPGFTPSFRTSGIYHKLFSQPEYGTFSKQFLSYANSRTNDAIHSILVHGNYSFEGCRHNLSFGYESCFDKIDNENILIANVGTSDIVFAQLHHVESVYKVPYLIDSYHKGIIYYNETEFSEVIQKDYAYTINKMTWNRKKIRHDLIHDGVLTEYDLSGLKIRFFRAKEFREAIGLRIKNDPYYLIS